MVAAVRVHKLGGPEVLTYEDIEIAAPGQGQIRVKQHACGVNFVDVYFRTGAYPSPVGLPFVLGNEGAGEVVAVGPGVCRFQARRSGRLRRRARLIRCGTAGADRSRREAAGEYRLRAGRRHDAQGHDGGISPAPHLQGGEGHERAHPRGGRRRRPHPVPMGEPSRRQRDRHGRVEGQSGPCQGQRLPPHDPVPRRGFRRPRQGDHRRQAVRGGL